MDFDIEKPGVPSPVAYRSMHDWQRLCVKRSGQCSPPKGCAPAVRKERDLRAAMRMEARLDGMTNVSELLKKHRKLSRAKAADRLGPKRHVAGYSLIGWDYADMHATGEEAGSNPLMLLKRNRVSPYFRPMRASRPQGRLMEVWVEERGESECRSVMDRIGVATSSRAKASRLPQGLSSQENDQNPLNGRKANERCTIGRVHFPARRVSSRKEAGIAYCEGVTEVVKPDVERCL